MAQKTTRNAEPTNEKETQQLKSFLQKGAATRIDEIDQFAGPAGVIANLGQPVTVPYRVDSAELDARVRQAEDNQTLLTIAIDRVVAATDCLVRVFINKDDADERTPLDDSHYLTTIAFFCHDAGGEGGRDFTCQVGEEATTALRYRFNITRLLRDSGAFRKGEPGVTFVVVPVEGRQPRTAAVSVASTELRLVKSVVRR